MYTREIVDQDVIEVQNEADLVDNLMKNNKLNFNSKVRFEALKHYGNSASLLEMMRKSISNYQDSKRDTDNHHSEQENEWN